MYMFSGLTSGSVLKVTLGSFQGSLCSDFLENQLVRCKTSALTLV